MYIMIGSTNCSKCVQVKELLRKEGLLTIVQYYDSHSSEGRKIMNKYKPKHIPFFVVENKPVTSYLEFLKALRNNK